MVYLSPPQVVAQSHVKVSKLILFVVIGKIHLHSLCPVSLSYDTPINDFVSPTIVLYHLTIL
jgi:hypothetical protein